MAKKTQIYERNTKPDAPEKRRTARAPVDTSDKQAIREQYQPYVRSIAGKIHKTIKAPIELDKLIEFGTNGLLEAADEYDPKVDGNFMAFAYFRIRGAIYEGLRQKGYRSAAGESKARFEERANEYLSQMQGMKGSGDDSDKPFESAVKDLASAVQGLAQIYIASVDSAESNVDELAAARNINLEAIDKLNNQERKLMKLYYYKNMSLRDVAEQLGLSKSRTSRMHTRAIDKLRRIMQDANVNKNDNQA